MQFEEIWILKQRLKTNLNEYDKKVYNNIISICMSKFNNITLCLYYYRMCR